MERASLITAPEFAETRALCALKRGDVIVFPTDTVYGIGGNALDPSVRSRVAEYKGRDPKKPLPWLVADIDMAKHYGAFSHTIEELAKESWPGATTIIILTPDMKSSVGMRVPEYAWLQNVIAKFNGPIIGTSANLSGEDPAITSKAAERMFPQVDLFIDGGICDGPPSRIIDATGRKLRTLRE